MCTRLPWVTLMESRPSSLSGNQHFLRSAEKSFQETAGRVLLESVHQVWEGAGGRAAAGLAGGAPEQAAPPRTEVQSVRICHSLQILSWQVLVVSGFSRCWQR